LCFLRIGDRIAAAQLAVESDERFWLLKIGYDEAFARYSPGNLLMRETVRYAANRGLLSYEFLGTPEQWTRMWTDRIRACVSIRAYPARPWGVAALVADAVHTGVHKLSVRLGRRR
jgi:CelD/BcsL family acetyltransferase involved in cellulose biosynthesis